MNRNVTINTYGLMAQALGGFDGTQILSHVEAVGRRDCVRLVLL